MGEAVASVERVTWCVVGIGLLAFSPAGLAQADHGKSALTERDRTAMDEVGWTIEEKEEEERRPIQQRIST